MTEPKIQHIANRIGMFEDLRYVPTTIRMRLLSCSLNLSLAVVATACATVPLHRPRTPPPSGAPQESNTVLVPPLRPPRMVLSSDDDRHSVVAVGGIRVGFSGRNPLAAGQSLASAIVGGAHAQDGAYWFALESGAIVRADDPLGTARLITRSGKRNVRARAWQGGLLVEHEDHTVKLYGASTGAEVPAQYEPSVEESDAVDAETAGVAASTALRAVPWARLALDSTVLLESGGVAVIGEHAVTFTTLDATLRSTNEQRVSFEHAAGSCTATAWGDRVLLRCREGVGELAREVALVVDPQGVYPFGVVTDAPMIAGREGHTITWLHACPGRPAARETVQDELPPGIPACTFRDGNWRQWERPQKSVLLDVYDDVALIKTDRAGVPMLSLYHTDIAREVPLRLSDPTADPQRAGFTADGRIMVVARRSTPRGTHSLVGVAPMGEPIALNVVGGNVTDMDAGDGRHLLAAGSSANALFESDNNGRGWHPAVISALHALRDTQLQTTDDSTMARTGSFVRCNALMCRVGDRVIHVWNEPLRVAPTVE